ncbi:hypothetical protein EDF58_12515, partial [Novosphingobium sp. PhB57]
TSDGAFFDGVFDGLFWAGARFAEAFVGVLAMGYPVD